MHDRKEVLERRSNISEKSPAVFSQEPLCARLHLGPSPRTYGANGLCAPLTKNGRALSTDITFFHRSFALPPRGDDSLVLAQHAPTGRRHDEVDMIVFEVFPTSGACCGQGNSM